ncbi:MAG: hypothetical protein WDZ80_00480 [Candidatus Paceibacterota bacterium]
MLKSESIIISRHPVPKRYHKVLYIGDYDRRGDIIDFKVPPIIVNSPISITKYKKKVFDEHVDVRELPLVCTNSAPFIVLRPTGLPYRFFVREQIKQEGLSIVEEFALDNFMQFADAIYELNPNLSFHWQWRIIMRSLHDVKIQNQNKAYIFILKNGDYPHDKIMKVKKKVRTDMGEVPVIVKYNGKVKLALGIHHLHAPDFNRILIEYNALIHAKNKTSIFSQ